MAYPVEPMDIDNIVSDFDNKENAINHGNVLSRAACTEKGYEELDVSELNMKLRYSITPASSPISKSFTANSLDNKNYDSKDVTADKSLSQSFNSTIVQNESMSKSIKTLPLQMLPTDQFENSRNISVLRSLDSTLTQGNNVTVSISGPNDDEYLSLPSTSSSTAHTPELTTPTKDVPKNDGGSPIMRGLKSMLNMFRTSTSPVPPGDDENKMPNTEGTDIIVSKNDDSEQLQKMVASTPVASQKIKDASLAKRTSPQKESIVFNDDLEKELQWNDDTTIVFKHEKIPIHKILFPNNKISNEPVEAKNSLLENVKKQDVTKKIDTSVEYMDISYNDSVINDKTMSGTQTSNIIVNEIDANVVIESDSEFLDCESVSKTESHLLDTKSNKDSASVNISDNNGNTFFNTNESLEATLSLKSEELSLESLKDISEVVPTTRSNDNIVNLNNSYEGHIKEKEPSSTTINEALETKTNNINNDEVSDTNFSDNVHVKITLNECKIGNEVDETVVSKNKSVYEKSSCESVSSSENVVSTSSESISNFSSNELHQVNNNNIFLESENVANLSMPDVIPETITPVCGTPSVSVGIPPTDIPLPDDDDIEKVILPSLDNPILTDFVPKSNSNDKYLSEINNEISNHISVNSTPPVDCNIITECDIKTIQENYLEAEDAVSFKASNQDILIVNSVEENCNPINSALLEIIQNEPLMAGSACVNENNVAAQNEVQKFEEIKSIHALESKVKEITTQNIISGGLDVKCSKYNVDEINIENASSNPPELTVVRDGEFTNKNSEEKLINAIHMNTSGKETDLGKITSESVQTSFNTSNPDTCQILNKVNEKVHVTNSAMFSNNVLLEKSTTDINEGQQIKVLSDKNDALQEIVPAEISISPDNSDICHVDKTEHGTVDIKNDDFCNNMKTEDILKDLNNDQQIRYLPIEQIVENKDKVDEEIIVSENGSPYVSLTGEIESNLKESCDQIQYIENQTVQNNDRTNAPKSPIIVSKGYNFNFDEMDDPFATKTKIRQSPPHIAENEIFECIENKIVKPSKKDFSNNRRKSQPVKRRPVNNKNKFNKTLDIDIVSTPETICVSDMHVEDNICSSKLKKNETSKDNVTISQIIKEGSTDKERCAIDLDNIENVLQPDTNVSTICVENKKEITMNISEIETEAQECLPTIENTNASSSDHSVYFSAGTSSSETVVSRNVFNLPEIGDVNFNPFITKSKVRQSPSPSMEVEDSVVTNLESLNCTVVIPERAPDLSVSAVCENEASEIENKPSEDASDTTCSSKTTEDASIRAVNTEDEDTVEGPFLDTEELSSLDKLTTYEANTSNLMQFTDLPSHETINDNDLNSGEIFIDAQAYEFLLNQNMNNEVTDSGKESLFLKFDPLFAKRASTGGVVSALHQLQKKQSTPKKTTDNSHIINNAFENSNAGPSMLDITHEEDVSNTTEVSYDDLNVTVSKPMMVVNPAVNPVVVPRNKTTTPTRSNRRSFTFTSPAMAAIDRLLSLSGNSSLLGQDTTVTHVNREQQEAEMALTQLRELLSEKEINVHHLRSENKELHERLVTLETQLQTLEIESDDRLNKINEMNETLQEKTKMNRSMAAVVEEYERTIASLITETEQDRKRHAEERNNLVKERDEQAAHLANLEVSFGDLHSKYEKSKQVILGLKANEDACKKSVKDFEANLSKMQANYDLLKQHATSKLNHANQELEKINRSHEAEVLKLNAMIKRKELHITSLEETLAQKTKANEELTAICDELINKVG